jgi:hypothetical protein
MKRLDSGIRRNDGKMNSATFFEFINLQIPPTGQDKICFASELLHGILKRYATPDP